jgi:hypothetical protein
MRGRIASRTRNINHLFPCDPLVRKTLSFSQRDHMHEICLRLFLHEYNCAIRDAASPT